MDCLIIKEPYTDLILSGVKTWEIRGSRTHKRGKIGLIKSGSGTIIGEADLVDCIGPLSLQEFLNNKDKHQSNSKELMYKKKLKLDNVIDIICQAELAKLLESRYLLLSSALELCVEVIRNKNNLNVEEDNDVIINMTGTINKYLKQEKISIDRVHIKNICSKLAFKTLKKKINAVLKHLEFEYSSSDIKRIKDNRNKIVHEVRFVDYTQPLKDYELIKLLVDKILLKILTYSGNVINYSNKYKVEKIF